MFKTQSPPSDLDPLSALKEVEEMFFEWRKKRKTRGPIPSYLWEAVRKLSVHIPPTRISRTLRLNYTTLMEKIREEKPFGHLEAIQGPTFIEMDMGRSHIRQSRPGSAAECVIEMKRADGAELKMRFTGGSGVDPLELGRAFWGGES